MRPDAILLIAVLTLIGWTIYTVTNGFDIEARQSEMCAEYGREHDIWTEWSWDEHVCHYDPKRNWRGKDKY